MSLTPRKEINFDAVGLADDDDYVLDNNGIGHFHKVKAGSTWQFRLKVTGVDATVLTWNMDVRVGIGSATAVLSTAMSGDATITVITDPAGDDTEEVEFTIDAPGTLMLQSGGTGNNFDYDINVAEAGKADVWFGGTGITVPTVTRP